MSLRKIAGLLVAFGLMVGLIGSGVSAVFHDQVTATENIAVGTFGCQIVSGNGTISNVPHTGSTITYNAPQIVSSVAGNAPFTFTVQNVGSIPQQLTITASPVSGTLDPLKFSAMTLAPASPVNLAGGVSQAFNTGIQWTALDNGDLGSHGWVTWTVDCGEVPATHTVRSAALSYGPTGWGGWSCDHGQIVSASISDNTFPIASLTLWRVGASVGAINYPNTGTAYVYTSPTEEGAIAQNGGTGQTVHIDLVCTGL